jgi:hypothetical protein
MTQDVDLCFKCTTVSTGIYVKDITGLSNRSLPIKFIPITNNRPRTSPNTSLFPWTKNDIVARKIYVHPVPYQNPLAA